MPALLTWIDLIFLPVFLAHLQRLLILVDWAECAVSLGLRRYHPVIAAGCPRRPCRWTWKVPAGSGSHHAALYVATCWHPTGPGPQQRAPHHCRLFLLPALSSALIITKSASPMFEFLLSARRSWPANSYCTNTFDRSRARRTCCPAGGSFALCANPLPFATSVSDCPPVVAHLSMQPYYL